MPHTKKRPIHSWCSYHFFPPSSSRPQRKLAFQWFWSHEVATAHRDKQQQTSGWTVNPASQRVGGETFWVLTTWELHGAKTWTATEPHLVCKNLAPYEISNSCAVPDTSNTTTFFRVLQINKQLHRFKAIEQPLWIYKNFCVLKKLQPFFWIRKLNGWILYITWPQSSIGAKFPRGSKGTGGRPRPAMPLP